MHLHINYDKKVRYFEYQSNNHVYIEREEDFINKNNYEILDLTSKNNKMFIGLHPRIYHNLVDNLAEILYLDQYFKSNSYWGDFEFILDSSDIPNYFYMDDGPTFFKFFLNVLQKKHVNFRIINSAPKRMQEINDIDTSSYPNKNVLIKVNNCAVIKQGDIKLQNFILLSNLFKEYYKDVIPNKTVYLSRNVKNANYLNTERQKEENDIEDFFKSNGCEIIVPETFDTFEDQIKYFSSVKTLIGLTGSGLLNMLMMLDNSNVVEIYTPIESSPFDPITRSRNKTLSTHHFYREVAWAKHHTHISIKNEYKSNTKKLINNLSNNKILMGLLNEKN